MTDREGEPKKAKVVAPKTCHVVGSTRLQASFTESSQQAVLSFEGLLPVEWVVRGERNPGQWRVERFQLSSYPLYRFDPHWLAGLENLHAQAAKSDA